MNLIRLIMQVRMPRASARGNRFQPTRCSFCYSYCCYCVKIDPYIVDTLMRDLLAHSRSSAAFLVYLQLYRHTHGAGRDTVAISHSGLAGLTGLSKRSVQMAIQHLNERRLIRIRKPRPTAVPVYSVLTPWIERKFRIRLIHFKFLRV